MYRYANAVEGFTLPLRIYIDEKPVWLEPTATWQKQKVKGDLKTFTIDSNFYMDSKSN